MGQYYVPLVKREEKYTAYSIQSGLKLMEHAWVGNIDSDGIAALLYKSPAQVAWVGDYANETAEERAIYRHAYDGVTEEDIPLCRIDIRNKVLVNHTKKEYVVIADDLEESVHPLPLLTAIGNGRGGGDYRGSDEELVGSWAMDTISLEDDIPKGYRRLNADFRVQYDW